MNTDLLNRTVAAPTTTPAPTALAPNATDAATIAKLRGAASDAAGRNAAPAAVTFEVRVARVPGTVARLQVAAGTSVADILALAKINPRDSETIRLNAQPTIGTALVNGPATLLVTGKVSGNGGPKGGPKD